MWGEAVLLTSLPEQLIVSPACLHQLLLRYVIATYICDLQEGNVEILNDEASIHAQVCWQCCSCLAT